MERNTLERVVESMWPPGLEGLARHVHSLNTLAGKAGWLMAICLGPWITTLVVYFADRSGGPDRFLYTQAVMVLGAFVLVDVVGQWGRPALQKTLGDRAYAFAFSCLFVPGLFFGFLPGVFHIVFAPGQRLLPLVPALLLASPFLLLGLAISVRIYSTFGLDRFLYTYQYHPDEDEMVDLPIFRHVRHPQYASFMLLCTGLTLAAATWQGLVMTLFIVVFFLGRIFPEERNLVKRYGQSYLDYRNQVPAYFPPPRDLGRFLKMLVRWE